MLAFERFQTPLAGTDCGTGVSFRTKAIAGVYRLIEPKYICETQFHIFLNLNLDQSSKNSSAYASHT